MDEHCSKCMEPLDNVNACHADTTITCPKCGTRYVVREKSGYVIIEPVKDYLDF